MEVKVGDLVSVRHYTGTKLYRGVIVRVKYEELDIKFLEEVALLNCVAGDPVVLGFDSESQIHIASCNVVEVDKKENKLILKVDAVQTLANKRFSERFPVSFLASIRIGESQTSYMAVVKNVSFTGMLVHSKTDFPLYQELKLNLNLGVMVSLKAIIVRKQKNAYNYEYGLKLVYIDATTPALLKKYLSFLMKEQEDFVRKLCVPIEPKE